MVKPFSIINKINRSDIINFEIKIENSVESLNIVKLPVDPATKLNQQALAI
jgi:hypothetical protein